MFETTSYNEQSNGVTDSAESPGRADSAASVSGSGGGGALHGDVAGADSDADAGELDIENMDLGELDITTEDIEFDDVDGATLAGCVCIRAFLCVAPARRRRRPSACTHARGPF